MGETVLILLYAFVGFEGTVVIAGEGRNPRRDLPGALIQTTLVIAVIYVLVQIVSMAVLPDLASSSTALADVAAVLFGPAGRRPADPGRGVFHRWQPDVLLVVGAPHDLGAGP